jgi:hypothetical protein
MNVLCVSHGVIDRGTDDDHLTLNDDWMQCARGPRVRLDGETCHEIVGHYERLVAGRLSAAR